MECILLTASNEIKDLGIILLLELKRELILNGEFRKAKLALRDKVLFFFFSFGRINFEFMPTERFVTKNYELLRIAFVVIVDRYKKVFLKQLILNIEL